MSACEISPKGNKKLNTVILNTYCFCDNFVPLYFFFNMSIIVRARFAMKVF